MTLRVLRWLSQSFLIARVAFHLARGPRQSAEEVAERIIARASEVDWGAEIAMVARGQLGFSQLRRGRLSEAMTSLGIGVQLPTGRIGIIDSALGFRSDLGVCILLTGEIEKGLATLRDADATAEAGGHPPTLAERLASPSVAAYHDVGCGWLRRFERS